METVVIGKPARGVLPRAKGHDEWKNEYKIQNPVSQYFEKYSSYLSTFFKEAVKRPGIRVVKYSEENGYEYETYAIFDPETRTITSNYFGCPGRCNHHIGSTCGCCGQKD